MGKQDNEPRRLREAPDLREELREKLDHYLDLPLALAPVKRRYVRKHWLDVLVVLLPFLQFLRLARVLRATRALPVLRLLIIGGRGSESTLALLKRRRLGQLAIVSVMVILLGSAVSFLLEVNAPGAQIRTFGDAL